MMEQIFTLDVLSKIGSIHARKHLSKSIDSHQDLASLLEFVQRTADDADQMVLHHTPANHI